MKLFFVIIIGVLCVKSTFSLHDGTDEIPNCGVLIPCPVPCGTFHWCLAGIEKCCYDEKYGLWCNDLSKDCDWCETCNCCD